MRFYLAIVILRTALHFFSSPALRSQLPLQSGHDLARAVNVGQWLFAGGGLNKVSGTVGERIFDGHDGPFADLSCGSQSEARRRLASAGTGKLGQEKKCAYDRAANG